MRKLFVLLVLVFAVALFPAAAQDEPGTIADIVVASATAEEAEFTILLAAVQAANPIFLEVLSNPDFQLTVFAPTDAAFVTLLGELGMTAEDVLGNEALLNTVLAYHVVPAAFTAETVVGLDGAFVGTSLPGQALSISVSDEGVFVNDAGVIAVDVLASNGVVHVIDSVLVPDLAVMGMDDMMEMPELSIAEIVIASAEAEEAEFTVLLAGVLAADEAVVATLSGPGYFTVFAPTDAAFVAALEALGITAEDLLGDTETLTKVLVYHVVAGSFTAEDLVGLLGEEESITLATLHGAPVTFSADEMGAMVDGANIVAVDIAATNGVVHVIDAVILPPMGDEME